MGEGMQSPAAALEKMWSHPFSPSAATHTPSHSVPTTCVAGCLNENRLTLLKDYVHSVVSTIICKNVIIKKIN